MKKILCLTCITLLAGCGGTLTKEQREEMKEGMNSAKIKRVTEAQLFEEATKQGHDLVAIMNNLSLEGIDSLAKAEKVIIKWLGSEETVTNELQKQILNSYLSGAAQNRSLGDNIQDNSSGDTLIYSSPKMKNRSDGKNELDGIWVITFLRKELILKMN